MAYDRPIPDDTRYCACGCGLAVEPGDVYCAGCRDGADRDAEIDRMDGSDTLAAADTGCNETRCGAEDCQKVMRQPATGRRRVYCSTACRVRTHRATRVAG